MRSIGTQLVAVSLSALFASAALAQDWTFVNLHPGGSSSSCVGASGGQQLGRAFGRPGIWSGSAGSWQALYVPPEYDNCYASEIDAGQVVGWGDYWWGYPPHFHQSDALLWRANGALEILPGLPSSTAFGISGSQQVGEIYLDTLLIDYYAAMWSGSAHSYVLLRWHSTAVGCYADQQVGYAWLSGSRHASLWTGTAESWVDLNPTGSSSSAAEAVYAGEQVGSCVVDGITRASLWRGTAASWVDLAPPGAQSSSAYAVYEGMQVGVATVGGRSRASLWRGSADSWVDLSAYLPSELSGSSSATGISSDGAFIYVVGTASSRAVMWRAPICDGDLDGNRIVNLQDLAVLLSNHGTGEGATPGDGDLDGDGDVDLQDLAVLLARFGSTCP